MYLTALINGTLSKIIDIHIDNEFVFVSYQIDNNKSIKTIKKIIQDFSTILATNIDISSDSNLPLNIDGQLNGNIVKVIVLDIMSNYAYFVFVSSDNTLRTVRKLIQNFETILLLNTIYQTSGTGNIGDISGTENYLAKFGATGNNVENSQIVDSETLITFNPTSADVQVIFNSTSGNLMTLDDNKVGIGIFPTQKLDVLGNINIDEDSAYMYAGVEAFKLAKDGYTDFASTMVGLSAGYENTNVKITTIGYQAGYTNSGTHLNAVGYYAGVDNLADYVTSIGYQSGRHNKGSRLNAIGYIAGYGNSATEVNAMGSYAGYQNSGTYMVALGFGGGYQNSGTHLNAVGFYAGRENSATGVNAMGRYAGYQNSGTHLNAVGFYAGSKNSATEVNAMGSYAGYQNSGTYLNGVGYEAGYQNKPNYVNALGYRAGYQNSGESLNAIGYESGRINSGNYLNALGIFAGYANSGSNVVAIGEYAGYQNSGSYTIALGFNAGRSNSGGNVVGIGYFAGRENTSHNLVAIGEDAGYQNSGTSIVALGYGGGYKNSGDYVVALGQNSCNSNSGDYVVALGLDSANKNSGNNVVAIGYQAGYNNTTDNLFILKQGNVNVTPLIQGNFSTSIVTIAGAFVSETSITTPAFKMTTDAVEGYYLKSDANGNGSWNAVAASQTYKGTWNANTNTPTLSNTSGTDGDYYRTVVSGTTDFGAGNISFDIGDDAYYNGLIWEKIPGSAYVLQVATDSILGGIKVGGSLQINSEVLNVNNADFGDITVAGTGANTGKVWTIDNGAVTFAKMQNISTAHYLGRLTADTGVIEELTAEQVLEGIGATASTSISGTENYLAKFEL
jgi:hypothetical protein